MNFSGIVSGLRDLPSMALEWIATFVPAVAGLIMDDELECVCKETAVACFIYILS
jgi:hypothetical protein